MKKLIVLFALLASPALAETEEAFFSLKNTEFIVLLAFLLFVAILLWQKVPAKLGAMLDARATQIKADLDQARALREEAKVLLASYEKKQKEVLAQSERIIASAKEEAPGGRSGQGRSESLDRPPHGRRRRTDFRRRSRCRAAGA